MKWQECRWCSKPFINYGTRQEFCSRGCNRKFNKLLIELETEKYFKDIGREKPKYIRVIHVRTLAEKHGMTS